MPPLSKELRVQACTTRPDKGLLWSKSVQGWQNPAERGGISSSGEKMRGWVSENRRAGLPWEQPRPGWREDRDSEARKKAVWGDGRHSCLLVSLTGQELRH